MKKFKFTLQTVHKVREMRQEKEKIVLGELRAEADDAASHAANVEKLRSEAIDNYSRRLKSDERLNPMEMELNSNHFASLMRLQQEAENIVEQKKRACVRQGETVAAAMREVKVTDQLRETQKERHQQEFARQEQNSIDELVTTKFARQMQQTK